MPGKRYWRRSATSTVAVLTLALSASAHAGPFDGLHTIEGVNTSRNGRWVSAGVSTEDYRAKVPGYEEVVTRAMGSDHQRMFLQVDCRAGPDTEYFASQSAQAEIAIPDHPEQEPYNWWHPMYWIAGMAGTAIEAIPVTVTLTDVSAPERIWHTEKATLERYRTDYSAIRTLLSVWIDAPRALEMLALGRAIRIEVRGEDTHIIGSFPAAPQLAEAVEKMKRHCPKP